MALAPLRAGAVSHSSNTAAKLGTIPTHEDQPPRAPPQPALSPSSVPTEREDPCNWWAEIDIKPAGGPAVIFTIPPSKPRVSVTCARPGLAVTQD